MFKNENDTEQDWLLPDKTYNIEKGNLSCFSYWNLRTVNLSVCCLLALIHLSSSYLVMLNQYNGSPLPVGAMLSFVSRGSWSKRKKASLWIWEFCCFPCSSGCQELTGITQRHSLLSCLTLTRTQHVSPTPSRNWSRNFNSIPAGTVTQ